jgi:tetratricopeptide (TPR) repeat protein
MSSRSSIRLCAVVLVITLAPACNKGKTIIEDATAVYLAGDTLAAAQILERVQKEAPNTPEVNEARSLAVEWLSRKSELEMGEGRRIFVAAALKWAPNDPDLQARRCEVELHLEQWDAARACLAEVDGRIPKREHARQEEVLTSHDKQVADAEKRSRLLESDDAISWYKLRKEFPDSEEAQIAGERLPAASLCADLARFSEALFTGGQTGPGTWGARLREQDSQGYQRSVMSDIRRSSAALSEQLLVMQAELAEHALMVDEREVRDHLLDGYTELQPAMADLAGSFTGKAYKIEARIKRINRFARGFLATEKKVEEARAASQKACEVLGR